MAYEKTRVISDVSFTCSCLYSRHNIIKDTVMFRALFFTSRKSIVDNVFRCVYVHVCIL